MERLNGNNMFMYDIGAPFVENFGAALSLYILRLPFSPKNTPAAGVVQLTIMDRLIVIEVDSARLIKSCA